jgi:hypothetical protein
MVARPARTPFGSDCFEKLDSAVYALKNVCDMKIRNTPALIGWATLAIFSSVLLAGCHTPGPDAKTAATTLTPETNQPATISPVPAPAPPVAKTGPSFETTRDWIITTLQQYGGCVNATGTEATRDRSSAEIGFQNVLISNSGILTYTREDKYQHQLPGQKKFYKARFSFNRKIPLGAITDVQVVIKTNMNYIANTYTTTPYVSIKTGNLAVIEGACVIQNDGDKDAKGAEFFERTELGEGNDGYDGMGIRSVISDEITLEINRTPDAVPGQPMPDDPEKMARRLATALQHMVDICKETYKGPSQAPTPF